MAKSANEGVRLQPLRIGLSLISWRARTAALMHRVHIAVAPVRGASVYGNPNANRQSELAEGGRCLFIAAVRQARV